MPFGKDLQPVHLPWDVSRVVLLQAGLPIATDVDPDYSQLLLFSFFLPFPWPYPLPFPGSLLPGFWQVLAWEWLHTFTHVHFGISPAEMQGRLVAINQLTIVLGQVITFLEFSAGILV
jgi:hypothetical protein